MNDTKPTFISKIKRYYPVINSRSSYRCGDIFITDKKTYTEAIYKENNFVRNVEICNYFERKIQKRCLKKRLFLICLRLKGGS